MNERRMKKNYEPIQIRYVRFETESVLFGSGFFGDEDDLTKKANVRHINGDYSNIIKDKSNPI